MPARPRRPATPVGRYSAPNRMLDRPVFAQPEPTEDPTSFLVRHASDATAYKLIDSLNKQHKLAPLPFPAPRGGVEPKLTLQQILGDIDGAATAVKRTARATIQDITRRGQIVFHALGDCGSTRGPKTQNEVVDKLLGDFKEANEKEIPQFHFLLGDIVYSFGEVEYYFDQFYDPYRDYPAPILAAAGNHDGMVSPLLGAKSLDGYLRNFCAETFMVMPEAHGLSRTAQIQPGVFFTFEAPFLRIITLYSNALEDPGVIANDAIGHSQLRFIEAALTRVKTDGFTGAVLFADHHPPFTAGRHGWSVEMSAQIDAICAKTGVWPHAFLSGHAHNYQRFTRTRKDGTQISYVVCGNGGHNVQRLGKSNGHTIRAPQVIQKPDKNTDQVVLENYDDQDYGYLRVVADAKQLRIEYHLASDGVELKAPDDAVTVSLAARQLDHYAANDLGHPKAGAAVNKARKDQRRGKKK